MRRDHQAFGRGGTSSKLLGRDGRVDSGSELPAEPAVSETQAPLAISCADVKQPQDCSIVQDLY